MYCLCAAATYVGVVVKIAAKVFASSEDEAELQRRENLRARDAEVNNLNTDRRNMGK